MNLKDFKTLLQTFNNLGMLTMHRGAWSSTSSDALSLSSIFFRFRDYTNATYKSDNSALAILDGLSGYGPTFDNCVLKIDSNILLDAPITLEDLSITLDFTIEDKR